MPYNRAKGRTCEIPPSPSPGGSRLGVATDPEGRSRAGSFSASVTRLISPHDINARLESQLGADVGRSEHDDDDHRRRRWVVLLRWPAALLRLLVVRPLRLRHRLDRLRRRAHAARRACCCGHGVSLCCHAVVDRVGSRLMGGTCR
ncbi:hypothetical protein BN1723_004205 [Verticillium longisporum]|uniref:Uncharacterized protein n=1 Tax=Verticillium longisporum TaxID=100787 RepID=A0A0G4MQA9_VERLO|nr:hypothetical protein BN1723_004205 [Verticillium longisporum]